MLRSTFDLVSIAEIISVYTDLYDSYQPDKNRLSL